MINSNNERGGFVSGERVDLDTSNQTDSLRKRRLAADVSDPDLQIITSKQKNTDCVFQVNTYKITSPEIGFRGATYPMLATFLGRKL